MDSCPSSPQAPSNRSNQSGSLPSPFSPQNSGVDDENSASVNVTVNGGDDGSEDDGFVSGEEEFDGKSTEGDGIDAPFVDSVENFIEKPMAKVSEDVGGDSEGDILRGTNLEQAGDGNLDLAGEGLVENLGPGLKDKEDLEQTESINSLNFGEVVKDSGFGDSNKEFLEASGGDGDNKGYESGKFDGITATENGVKVYDLKDEEVVMQEKNELPYDGQHSILNEADDGGEVGTGGNTLSGETYHSDSLIVESAYNNSVDNDDVKFAGTGDSVVDTPQVNLMASGVVVVGDKEEIEDSEIKGLGGPARGVSLDNGFDPIDQDAEEAFDKLANGDDKCDQNVNTGADDDDAGDAEKGQKNENASLEKDEILEFASLTLKDVQDDINTEAYADVRQTGSHVEASGDDGDDKGSEGGKLDAITAEENDLKLYDLKDEEVVIQENNELSYGRQYLIQTEADGGGEVDTGGNILSGETNHSDSLIDNSVENGDVKFRGAGDSLVDALQINCWASGVAVVGDKEEVEDYEIKGLEGPTCDGSLDNGLNPIDQDAEEAFYKLANGEAKCDQNVNNGTDDDAGDAENGQKNDITPLEKDEILEFASHTLKDVQDGINTEALAGVGKIGSHVEVSGDNHTLANGYSKCDQNVNTGADDDAGDAEKGQKNALAPLKKDDFLEFASLVLKDVQDDINTKAYADMGKTGSHVEASGDNLTSEHVNINSSWRLTIGPDEDDEEEHHPGDREIDRWVSDGEGEEMIFGSSEAAKQFLEKLEQQSGVGSHSAFESSRDLSQTIDGQVVTDSEEEVDTDDRRDGKELFDSAALAALLKAATGTGQDGGGITMTSQDGSRLFSVERPAGLGPSLQSGKPAAGSNRANLFAPSISRAGTNSDVNLSIEEKVTLEKLQQIRVKFLRLVQRLGCTPEESIAAQVLYRLTLVAGRQTGEMFSLGAAKGTASQLEAEGRDDLNFSLNVLVLGKSGVGKSATVNSIFGETKTTIGAYGPATTAVTEIVGMVNGVKIRIFDTPGLKSSLLEQGFNRKVLSMVKKLTKKSPPDIFLYVDRLDTQTRDLNDLPLLRSISNALGPSIWRNAIVTLTHAASAPPDGPSGSPLSYDVFVTQRSHIVQQTIGQAVGELRLMNPSLMNPVSLVENHASCRKNRDGQKVLPNGQNWRSQLLLLSFSMKILSEASNLSKTQDSLDQRRLFGFRVRSPPLPSFLSWFLQSRAHPKLPADQGGVDNGDSDIELANLSDSDLDEDEDEYDQLLPFKPLKKSQIAKLSREQRKAYFEEYDYRVKLLQKKQWREELRRMRAMKKNGKTNVSDYGNLEEDDQGNEAPAAVPVPLPDVALPPSFDSDNPAYRYRFLEPSSHFLTRPVLDTHSWDHDCGYDGVSLEHSLAIIKQFPAAVSVQITKDKEDFSMHLDSSVAAKHGENGSTMVGFDIQNIGKQLAYTFKGDTKFKNFKRNKTAAGMFVTFLGENVSGGMKIEDKIAVGKRLVVVGNVGTVRSQGDSAYGSNVEVRLREADFPIGQDQYALGFSLVKVRGDLALGANFQSQFSIGRSYKMAVHAALSNKLSGQITVKTSSSDQLQIALFAILPIARAIYNYFQPMDSSDIDSYYMY